MTLDIYYIDTFTDKLFSGNPAAVILLQQWLSPETMQEIAIENNLPATTFLLYADNRFSIRWFTPDYELPFCGHGTLAASHVIFNYLKPDTKTIDFYSTSELIHAKYEKDIIFLALREKSIQQFPSTPVLTEGLGIELAEVYQHQQERCMVILKTEDDCRGLQPDMHVLQRLPYRAVDVSAPGERVDFVCRTFYPKKIITEDPVCGIAQCLFVPYWAKRLQKTILHSHQASKRGGELFGHYEDGRVLLGGRCVTYVVGKMHYAVSST